MTIAYAPFNTSYDARTPYLSADEYINAPTALDTANLIPGGNATAQLIALTETIGRASSWVDQYTCGAWGTLCATVETENARVWGSYRGTLIVHPKYWPVVEVRGFSYSPYPGGLVSTPGASVTPSSSITVYPQEFEVSTTGVVSFGGTNATGFAGFGVANGLTSRVEYDCLYEYVCGWPNTYLAASVQAGSTSISPAVVTGIYPGSQLTIYDLPYDEPATVASTYAPGNAVVPLTTELQYSHPITATVTNLPPAIKQAAIYATTAFIKQRGSGALIAADIGEVTRTQTGFSQQSGQDWIQATTLLNPFRQVYVGW